MEPGSELTRILGRARAGDERARDELIALIYEELRQVVWRLMGESGLTTPSRPPRWSTRP